MVVTRQQIIADSREPTAAAIPEHFQPTPHPSVDAQTLDLALIEDAAHSIAVARGAKSAALADRT